MYIYINNYRQVSTTMRLQVHASPYHPNESTPGQQSPACCFAISAVAKNFGNGPGLETSLDTS